MWPYNVFCIKSICRKLHGISYKLGCLSWGLVVAYTIFTTSPLLLTNHKMTSVCFGIVKVQCQKLNIIRYLFSLSCMPMHGMLNKRKYAKKIKSKKNQNTLNMIASVPSRRCGSYRIYLEGDSPHQAVMIVCELKWFSHISNCHNM